MMKIGGMTESQREFRRLKTLGMVRDREPDHVIMRVTGADAKLIGECKSELGIR